MDGAGFEYTRRVTLFLFLLNLVVLAVGLGFNQYRAEQRPQLNEFNAEKIRFWSQPEAYQPKAVTQEVVPPASEPVPHPEVTAEAPATLPAPAPAAAPAAAPAPALLCLEIKQLSQPRYEGLHAYLKSSGMASGQCTYIFEKKLGWWVFWPPEYESSRRDKVMKAIQAAGVKDVLPINQGSMAQSISLGVFAHEAQANHYRDVLRGKGLEKVSHGPRPSMGVGLLGCRIDEPARLAGFSAGMPSWAEQVDVTVCGLSSEAVQPAIKPPQR